MEIWGYTLRELDWMATGREQAAWWHTSYQMALAANINRDKKRKPTPYRPQDFNPLERSQTTRPKLTPKESVKALRQVFMEGKIPDALE